MIYKFKNLLVNKFMDRYNFLFIHSMFLFEFVNHRFDWWLIWWSIRIGCFIVMLFLLMHVLQEWRFTERLHRNICFTWNMDFSLQTHRESKVTHEYMRETSGRFICLYMVWCRLITRRCSWLMDYPEKQ